MVVQVPPGFEARIVQHEFDHLNGVVFLDRMRDLRALAFREEWERYMADPPDDLAAGTDGEDSSTHPAGIAAPAGAGGD